VWAAAPSEVAREATYEFWYRAKKWRRQRRVVAVLVERVPGVVADMRSARDPEAFCTAERALVALAQNVAPRRSAAG